MLTLRRIEVQNFVCFDSLALEPSTDQDRPLTVIRAENGNGKTTFLRAVRWGMYGERGLPGNNPARYSLHPAWWNPNDEDVVTRVSIEFETDGSSRNFAATGELPSRYRLDRTVRTLGKPLAADDQPNFYRVDPRVTLMVRDASGEWGPHEKNPELVIEELLPWSLRDFFIMDADKATDFVGGSDENRTISIHDYQEKTTYAINSLLGLEVFKKAQTRINTLANSFSKKATEAIGDQKLLKLQEQLERAEDDKDNTQDKLEKKKDLVAHLADKLEELQTRLEGDLSRLSVYEPLSEQLHRNRQDQERSTVDRNSCLATLANTLESSEMLAVLAHSAITKTRNTLKPLYEQGRIPLAHLPFVRNLLETGRCVCGQDLTEVTEYKRRVVQRVAEASDEAARADYLYHLYQATLSLNAQMSDSTWNTMRTAYAAELASHDRRLAEMKLEQRDLQARLEEIDEEKIEVARDEIAAVVQQLDNRKFELSRHKLTLQELDEKIIRLKNTIAQRQKKERAAADYRAANDMAHYVLEVLNLAYSSIEKRQVKDLSAKMNSLFHQMAANVSDSDFEGIQHNRANLRMIAEVGVRQVNDRPDRYEIYALNRWRRAMPPVQINGASRRVLALAFVLALCDESNTEAPLIADSLLNVMAGAVRHNTLRVTSEHSKQPILLLTNADIATSIELEIVARQAGVTYTLTAQWDAVVAGAEGKEGDVINRKQQQPISLLCLCGPREYCDICERIGQAEMPGWVNRQEVKK